MIRYIHLHRVFINLFGGLPNHVLALHTTEAIDIDNVFGISTDRMDLCDEDSVELRVGVGPVGGAVVARTAGHLFNIC